VLYRRKQPVPYLKITTHISSAECECN